MYCMKYIYDGKGKIYQLFGVDKVVIVGQNFLVSKILWIVLLVSQKFVQVMVILVMEEIEIVYVFEVVWVESCLFSKDEGKKMGEECISLGGM